MSTKIVYQVLKALPKGEKEILYDRLKEEFEFKNKRTKINKRKSLKKHEAIDYLLENVFKKSINSKKTYN